MATDINERTFEFCYNSEFVARYSALLAAAPSIPTPRLERYLGYDVEHRIRHGAYRTSLFIQFKVSHFAESRRGKNKKFYDCYSGPYYRSAIDTEQHNLLRRLSRRRPNVLYSAPRFHTRRELNLHFRASTVIANSVLLPIRGMPSISDTEAHNFSFSPCGGNAYFHSEPSQIKSIPGEFSEKKERLFKSEEVKIDRDWLYRISEEVISEVTPEELSGIRAKSPDFEKVSPIKKAQYILGTFFGVVWVLLE